jgi:outer membrane protein OmpA-like peptidoglycan-associated protein
MISYGIYFDSGKDVVKPQSYGALKDIDNVLKENPGVRVKIVGHTDSDGDEAMNLELSKRRSQSVKNELNKTFGIDKAILDTDGEGESQPLVLNTSAEGKAKNRRVEFIKL